MISQLFNNAAHKHSERIVLVDGDRQMTYFELQVYVEWCARYFQGLGIQPGHRVALYIPNQHEFVISLLGLLPLGGVAVPLPLYDNPEDLRAALLVAKAHAVITIPPYREMLASVLAQQNKAEWPLHKIPLAVFEEDNIATAKGTLSPPETKLKIVAANNDENNHPGIGFLSSLVGRFDEHTAVMFLQKDEAGALAGTTLTHRALVAAAENFARASQMTGADCILAVLPFSQPQGLIKGLLAVIASGAKFILLPYFDETDVVEALSSEHVTVYPGAPDMFDCLLEAPADKRRVMSALRLCVAEGASLSPEMNQNLQREFGVAVQSS
ncbi:MAG: AMP-binding protein [candidate division KSB1 bacterium]